MPKADARLLKAGVKRKDCQILARVLSRLKKFASNDSIFCRAWTSLSPLLAAAQWVWMRLLAAFHMSHNQHLGMRRSVGGSINSCDCSFDS